MTEKKNKKEINYADAVAEIESIIDQIENNETDIDQIAQKAARAGELIKICKEKLRATESAIESLFDERKQK